MLALNTLIPETFVYLAATLVFLAFCMRTMLRLIAIASNIAFILYGLAGHLLPILALHGALLPLNLFRLIQMRRQVRRASEAARANPSDDRFDWLVAHGDIRTVPAGSMLFSKGDPADSLYIVVEGEIFVPEVSAIMGPGTMIGEIGLFSGDSRRTASARATGPVRLAEVTEQRVQELFFDNPHFAYRLIQLISRRLVANLKLLDDQAEARAAEPAGIAAR